MKDTAKHTAHEQTQKPGVLVEALAWAAGALLLIAYAAAQWHFDRSNESGLEQFATAARRQAARQQQVQPPSAQPNVAPSRQLDTSTPDMSEWSTGRIAAYQNADHSSAPQAVLRIPTLALEVPVYEGVNKSNLNRGAAWIQATAPLGARGNTGLASHRDGYFRTLRAIEVGARIELQTLAGTRLYAVDDISIVEPQDVHVLDPTAHDTLTLVTCYPFYVLGPAPKRFIVRARAVNDRLLSQT